MELVDVMKVALTFVEDVDASSAVDRLKSLEETITELLKEIGECCIFVRKYIDTGGRFLGNVVLVSALKSILTMIRTLQDE